MECSQILIAILRRTSNGQQVQVLKQSREALMIEDFDEH